jgi:hypothetical protein
VDRGDEENADTRASSGAVCDSDAEDAEGRLPVVRVEVVLVAAM